MTASCQRERTVACGQSMRWCGLRSVALGSIARAVIPLLILLLVGAVRVHAQKAVPDQQRARAKMEGAVREMGGDKRMKKMSEQQQWDMVEFVTGNMLFVGFHELGHGLVSQLRVPVLGREEDAVDSFATLAMLEAGTEFSLNVLVQAARGWFLSDRRDQKLGNMLTFYDEHGLDQQRAYQIVCLMVGSDEEKYKDLVEETKLPKERQDTCAGDFSNAAYSWDLVLTPHVRTPDQPEADITVAYREAKGSLEPIANALKSIKLLEAVAVHTAEAFVWPAPFKLEVQSCGFPNARWDLKEHKLFVCYELAADFADLYRGYGAKPMQVRALPAAKKKR